MTITEFLLARIGEDEADAATMQRWIDDMNANPPSVYGQEYPPDVAFADPDRVLAECEAKRRIVELHKAEVKWAAVDDCGFSCRHGRCPTLRILALPYADHPDYREEWRL